MSASSYQLQKLTTNMSSMNNSLNSTMFAANKASQYNLKTVNISLTGKYDQTMIKSRSHSKGSIKELADR